MDGTGGERDREIQPWHNHPHPKPGERASEAVNEWKLFLGAPGSVLARPRGPIAANGNAAAKLLTAPEPKNPKSWGDPRNHSRILNPTRQHRRMRNS
jgi:hypothetical protein